MCAWLGVAVSVGSSKPALNNCDQGNVVHALFCAILCASSRTSGCHFNPRRWSTFKAHACLRDKAVRLCGLRMSFASRLGSALFACRRLGLIVGTFCADYELFSMMRILLATMEYGHHVCGQSDSVATSCIVPCHMRIGTYMPCAPPIGWGIQDAPFPTFRAVCLSWYAELHNNRCKNSYGHGLYQQCN